LTFEEDTFIAENRKMAAVTKIAAKQPRPPRRHIPVAIRRSVVERQGGRCKCGCRLAMSEKPRSGCHFDHEPALRLRMVNILGTDYIPPQHDPAYIDARCQPSHVVKTNGSGATVAGSDTGKMNKLRKLEREERGQTKRKTHWPKGRKLKSRNNLRKRNV
jgi:hypothetical protein